MKIQKILCPLDFSDVSQKLLDYSVSFAKTNKAKLVLLHVIDHPHLYDNYQILAITPAEISEKLEKQAQKELSKIVNQIKNKIKVDMLVRNGKPFIEIIRSAKDIDADLVIIGSHGRSAIAHVLIGSTSEKVARKAPCPVLIFREKKGLDFVMP